MYLFFNTTAIVVDFYAVKVCVPVFVYPQVIKAGRLALCHQAGNKWKEALRPACVDFILTGTEQEVAL